MHHNIFFSFCLYVWFQVVCLATYYYDAGYDDDDEDTLFVFQCPYDCGWWRGELCPGCTTVWRCGSLRSVWWSPVSCCWRNCAMKVGHTGLLQSVRERECVCVCVYVCVCVCVCECVYCYELFLILNLSRICPLLPVHSSLPFPPPPQNGISL